DDERTAAPGYRSGADAEQADPAVVGLLRHHQDLPPDRYAAGHPEAKDHCAGAWRGHRPARDHDGDGQGCGLDVGSSRGPAEQCAEGMSGGGSQQHSVTVTCLTEGRLYAVSGTVPAPNAASWIPRHLRGHVPVSCYLLVDRGHGLLIDTGLPMHR